MPNGIRWGLQVRCTMLDSAGPSAAFKKPGSLLHCPTYIDQNSAVQQNHGKLAPSMYAEAEPKHPLERCLRVLPHHNDSGGFFVAVLHKTAEISVPRLVPCSTLVLKARYVLISRLLSMRRCKY